MVGAVLHDPRRIPPQLDWREMGFKTPPENQRDCGSCYAYSVATSIQGQIFKKTGMLIPLSEQQLIDCSTSTGNLGCSGGSLRNTLRYLEKAKGLMPQSRYSYTAKVRSFLFFLFFVIFLYDNTDIRNIEAKHELFSILIMLYSERHSLFYSIILRL